MFKLCPPIVANHSNIISSIPLKLQKQEHSDLSAKKVHLKYKLQLLINSSEK